MVLFWPVEGSLAEIHKEPGLPKPLNIDLSDNPTLYQIVTALDAAKDDDRVKAFVVSYRAGGIALAHIEELREAVARFRESGKPAIFFCPDMIDGVGAYYLASSFDEIWLQPVGTMMLTGISLEEPYLKTLLDKLGISATFFRRKEYKTVYESVTSAEMSEASRLMMTRLVEELSGNMSSGIAASREITPQTVKSFVDKGLFTDQEALASRLVDRLDYGDVLVDELNDRITGDPESDELPYVLISSYARKLKNRTAGPFNKKPPQVAVVYVSGVILPDKASSSAPLFLEGGIASALDISSAIKDATEDEDIKAIIIRVDSPGGSPTASESIRRAIELAKKEGKPVYVSMGPMAASGGYWVSASADRIFAMPSTLTGSIGVVGGKLVLAGLFDKIGVTVDVFQRGQNAGLFSSVEKFSQNQRSAFRDLLEETYRIFLQRVADSRKISSEKLQEYAQGRPLTGSQALEGDLIDEVGGLDAALQKARQEAGIPPGTDVSIVRVPKAESLVKVLFWGKDPGVRLPKTMGSPLSHLPEGARPLLRYIQTAAALMANHEAAAVMPAHISIK
jgi:protease-4